MFAWQGAALVWKPATTPDALSSRDKSVCDGFVSGSSRKVLAEQFGITRERIGQILNQPGAILYILSRGGATKALLYAKVGEEILTRTEWGGMRIDDLITIFKAAMPKELAVTITDHRKEAEAIAAEIGKPELVDQIERDLLISQEVR